MIVVSLLESKHDCRLVISVSTAFLKICKATKRKELFELKENFFVDLAAIEGEGFICSFVHPVKKRVKKSSI